MKLVSTKERARGRWHEVLPALGIDASFLTGKNCPCPMCGGTDRFRFIDKRGQERDGMWVCNQCQPKPRPAIDLAIAFTGKPFPEAAAQIDGILGATPPARSIAAVRSSDEDRSGYPQKVWRLGNQVRLGDVVDLYLRTRGVGLGIYPPCLRASVSAWYRDDASGETTSHPAMLGLVTNSAGEHVATHRTFLAADGLGKAKVAKPRKLAGPSGNGPAIRLMPAAPMMGIAEGIETALAASKLFQIPCWSVLCAYGIETFEPPPECRRLIVFADHDRHDVSQRATRALCHSYAARSTSIEIRMPDQPGSDWNDVLLRNLNFQTKWEVQT